VICFGLVGGATNCVIKMHGLRAEEGKVTVKMGNIIVVASLERKLVYGDPIHVLEIVTVP
jgi:hypothetical protein